MTTAAATARIALDVSLLDDILQGADAGERNEIVAAIQHHNDLAAENARWAALDADEAEILEHLAADDDNEE